MLQFKFVNAFFHTYTVMAFGGKMGRIKNSITHNRLNFTLWVKGILMVNQGIQSFCSNSDAWTKVQQDKHASSKPPQTAHRPRRRWGSAESSNWFFLLMMTWFFQSWPRWEWGNRLIGELCPMAQRPLCHNSLVKWRHHGCREPSPVAIPSLGSRTPT